MTKQASKKEPSSLSLPLPSSEGQCVHESSLYRILPTMVHPHVGSKIMTALVSATYLQNGPATFHTGYIFLSSMKISRRIAC